MCALSLLNLLSPSLNVCPGIFVAAPSLHPPLCVPHFTCENSPSLRSNRILSVLFIFVLVLHTPPLSVIPLIQSPRPSTIGTWQPATAIESHAVPFRCRSRPIRASHCTVGVVLAVSFCLVCGCCSGGCGPLSACLPTRALPSPWLCLAVLALKGRRHTPLALHSCLPHSLSQLSFHKHGRWTQQPCKDSLCLWPFEKQEIN